MRSMASRVRPRQGSVHQTEPNLRRPKQRAEALGALPARRLHVGTGPLASRLNISLGAYGDVVHDHEMLPEAKDEFPKFLYLDQNKWIDIARAHYGRDDGADFKDALAAVRTAVESGKLVVPISGVHVMETMAPADIERRRRTAEFIVDLSKNRMVVPYMSIRSLEILHAVLRVLGQKPMASVRSGLIREGVAYALGAEAEITGVPDHIRESLLTEMRAPAVSIGLLVEAADRATIRETRQQDAAAVTQLEEIRRRAQTALSDEMRHRVELAELFSKGEPGTELRETLRALRLPEAEFFEHLKSADEYIAFFHDIPTMDVFVTLSLARDRDTARPIHRNDLKDISFMAVAAPYANIIVTERYWGHQVKATGLASKYGTVISTDARELPNLLQQTGCL